MHLPSEFVERTKEILSSEWDDFLSALGQEPPVSIRINKHKAKGTDTLSNIVPWCENGYYLGQRPQFTFDPLLHAGCYYVQEASSMFVGQAIKPHLKEGSRVLDLCAAPGGKSTLIAGLLDEHSLLVSNELIRSRANILAENMMKWGKANTIVTNNCPADFSNLKEFFDIILVDAPCSGEGMFRKDEETIDEWSLANVNLCSERQQKIISDIWDSLKPDGILIYSTCTYNTEENEKNVRWISETLDAEILPINTEKEWKISPAVDNQIPAYRFFPHKTLGEGFFLSVLKKDGESQYTNRKKGRDKKQKVKAPSELHNLLTDSQDYEFFKKGNYWQAISKSLYEDCNYLSDNLNILNAGICLGEYKGKDFIPHQGLALSLQLDREAYPCFEVDWNTAITYLRRENIILPTDVKKGYVLLTHKDAPIGFVKNLGNRANNLYPQEWRIRSANIPNEPVSVIG